MNKSNKSIFITVTVIVSILFLCSIVMAQAIKTSIGEILTNPDKYDGKMVQVQGKVSSIKFKTSKRGNEYTTFKVGDSTNGSLSVFSFGTLPINRDDSVSVRGVYQKVKHVGAYTFYNEIDASHGAVEKIK